MAERRMLTSVDGPVVVGEKSLRALLAIRRVNLLPLVYAGKRIVVTTWTAAAVREAVPEWPVWLEVLEARAGPELPGRVAGASESEAATLRLALALPASLVIIDGPIKERVKLSFIKAEGVLSLLVQAHRMGHLSAVQPMVKALSALGHGDVLPPAPMLDALWDALGKLEDEE